MIAAYRNLALPPRFGFRLKALKKRGCTKESGVLRLRSYCPPLRDQVSREPQRQDDKRPLHRSLGSPRPKKSLPTPIAPVYFKASLRASPSTNGAINDIEFNTPIVSICEFHATWRMRPYAAATTCWNSFRCPMTRAFPPPSTCTALLGAYCSRSHKPSVNQLTHVTAVFGS